MSAPARKSGFLLKLERAGHQLESFEGKVLAFFKDNPCVITGEFDPKTSQKIWRFKDVPPEPYPEWGPLIGEILYDFRSCLDQLAHRLIEANRRKPSRNAAFPLCTNPAAFACEAATALRGIHPDALAKIEKFQPYSTRHRNQEIPKALHLLSWLGNEDKHRITRLHVLSAAGYTFTRSGEPFLKVPKGTRIFIGVISKAGTELARLGVSAEEQANVDFVPFLDIAFGQGGKAAGVSVSVVLRQIKSQVGTIVRHLGSMTT